MARPFGNVRQTGSGRWQARFHLPARSYPEVRQRNYTGPVTFTSEAKARRWLDQQRADIERGIWAPPVDAGDAPKPLLLKDYARTVIAERDISPRSREHAEQLLRDHINPTFGDVPVGEITADAVSTWYAKLLRNPDHPVARAHAYSTLRTVMRTAHKRKIITENPCQIEGAGQAETQGDYRIATLGELATIDAHVPDRYRMMVQLAVWCTLRFGEAAELRRSDVDLKHGVLRVRRAVTRVKAGPLVKRPKSRKGVRDVTIPSHILDDLRAHLRDHVAPGADAFLFPGPSGTKHLYPSQMQRWWYPAREAAGRPDLRFHDLRHTGATFVAQAGANFRELQNRLGDSTIGAAQRYVHEVDGRQREIADRMAAFATGGQVADVIPIDRARRAA